MGHKYFFLYALLSILGLALSVYLLYQYSLPQPVTCIGTGQNSCEVVRLSEHSYFLGVRLPIWGILFFGGLLSLLILYLQNIVSRYYFMILTGLMVVPGFFFETYKTFIQFYELGTFCVWCFTIEVVTTLLFALFIFDFKRNKGELVS